jgi:uncharacterized protein (DUF1684 family)
MSNINTNAIAAAIAILSAEGAAASVEQARAVKAQDRNKDQKLAVIADELTKLAQRFDDVANDRVTVRAAKAVYVPAVGDKVLATVGRNTATSQAKVIPGTVTAVKFPAEGEKGATQVRVRINEGTFDEQLVTLYPAQLVKQEAEVVAG